MLVAEGGIKLSALYPKQKSEGTTSDRPTSNRLAHNPCAHNSPPRKWQMVTRGTIRPSWFGLTCRLTMNGEYISMGRGQHHRTKISKWNGKRVNVSRCCIHARWYLIDKRITMVVKTSTLFARPGSNQWFSTCPFILLSLIIGDNCGKLCV